MIHPEFPALLDSLTKFPGISEPLLFPGVGVIIRHQALGPPVHKSIFYGSISRLIFVQYHPYFQDQSFPKAYLFFSWNLNYVGFLIISFLNLPEFPKLYLRIFLTPNKCPFSDFAVISWANGIMTMRWFGWSELPSKFHCDWQLSVPHTCRHCWLSGR